nr:NAD(P)/FAD-dependent oxidoreductase [Bacilli bacterium]
VGGVSLTEIDGNLASKNEAGVYFVGEVVDVDGLCGGNNLAWCLWSASEVAESL